MYSMPNLAVFTIAVVLRIREYLQSQIEHTLLTGRLAGIELDLLSMQLHGLAQLRNSSATFAIDSR